MSAPLFALNPKDGILLCSRRWDLSELFGWRREDDVDRVAIDATDLDVEGRARVVADQLHVVWLIEDVEHDVRVGLQGAAAAAHAIPLNNLQVEADGAARLTVDDDLAGSEKDNGHDH